MNTYYRFGLQLGFRNLIKNGLALGAKKTAGKILQPVNSFTRFPEYAFFADKIADYAAGQWGRPLRVLDVGSPKLFGLWLAASFNVEVTLTDIDVGAVEEARTLWNAVKRPVGAARFGVLDARNIGGLPERYDVVYSMSVIEHVTDSDGDALAVKEMTRVMKPGGLLLLSFPLGPRHVSQERKNFAGAAQHTTDEKYYFFQRVYSPDSARERIMRQLRVAGMFTDIESVVRRVPRWYRNLGDASRALLGWASPGLSDRWNTRTLGLYAPTGDYGEVSDGRDVYGDALIAWEKAVVDTTLAGRTANCVVERE
jgi:2-polyprenyl-3-methyl-5-hydroxy-6-metoxy-1,4-benzoquinol methylase